jgi:uncharacterized protein (TIGR04255 family)
MTDAPDNESLVINRSPNVDKYKRNYVTQAICELKFPTLLELGGAFPPAEFARALRRNYPTLDAGKEVEVNLGERTTEVRNAHIFRAAKNKWAATLKHSSVGIEGTAYIGYADFRRRISQLMEAALPVVDTDAWTRVGLRYMNTIHCEEDPIHGWVNPALVAPILADSFRKISNYAGLMQLGTDERGTTLRHQLKFGELNEAGEISSVKYILDIDAYAVAVPIEDTLQTLDALHEQSFDLFDWCLADAAREYLVGEDK